jgi:hypothetical protein
MCAEAIGEARRCEPKDERVPEALYQCISAVHLDARTLGSTSTQSRPFPCFIAAMRIAHGLWRIASGTGAAIACRTEPTANGPPGVVTRRAKSAGETLDGDHGNRGWIALPNSGREREFTAFSGPTCARRSPAHARFSSHSPKTRESERLRCGEGGIRTLGAFSANDDPIDALEVQFLYRANQRFDGVEGEKSVTGPCRFQPKRQTTYAREPCRPDSAR